MVFSVVSFQNNKLYLSMQGMSTLVVTSPGHFTPPILSTQQSLWIFRMPLKTLSNLHSWIIKSSLTSSSVTWEHLCQKTVLMNGERPVRKALPSGRRCRCVKCRRAVLRDRFYPTVITTVLSPPLHHFTSFHPSHNHKLYVLLDTVLYLETILHM